MPSKEGERDETVAQTVRNHPRDEAFAPKSDTGHYGADQQNRYQPYPTLVEMSLCEKHELKRGGQQRISA